MIAGSKIVMGVMATGLIFAMLNANSSATAANAAPTAPPAFAKCAACHAVVRGAPAKLGPNLAGIVGAKAGTRPGGRYSQALKNSNIIWTKANLSRYIKDPKATVPGTTMPNPMVARAADSDAIVAFLSKSK
jgi:cytochrome c